MFPFAAGGETATFSGLFGVIKCQGSPVRLKHCFCCLVRYSFYRFLNLGSRISLVSSVRGLLHCKIIPTS